MAEVSRLFISIFSWNKLKFFLKTPFFGLFLLWLLACLLALIGLGNLPLRDFDEATVARVALELNQSNGWNRVFPTIWNLPYLNKAPGLHWLIAFLIELKYKNNLTLPFLPAEFFVRLGPAICATFVVPLGGLIQWRLRPADKTSIFATSSILLTLLPLARHGRLAMLDGTQLSAIAFLWLMLLMISHPNTFNKYSIGLYALGAGFAGSALLLMKAPMLIPSALAALVSIAWAGQISRFFKFEIVLGIFLGFSPGLSWHVLNFFQRGMGALWLWWGDGTGRVLFQNGSGGDLGWRVPLIEMFEGGWPWLLLWPFALFWAWRERKSLWAQWGLGTQAILAISIFPLKTQLPWYSYPLWLPFALLCGPIFSQLIDKNHFQSIKSDNLLALIPKIWSYLGCSLLLFSLIGRLGLIEQISTYSLIAFWAGIGWGVGGYLLTSSLWKIRQWGAKIVLAGSFFALVSLMVSPLWLWELNEHWPVSPVAQLALRTSRDEVTLDAEFERPSLNWYSRKRIRLFSELPNSKLVITRDYAQFIEANPNKDCEIEDVEESWNLLLCKF